METRIPFGEVAETSRLKLTLVDYDPHWFKKNTHHFYTLQRGLNSKDGLVDTQLREVERILLRDLSHVIEREGVLLIYSNWVMLKKYNHPKWDTCCTMIMSITAFDRNCNIWLDDDGTGKFSC